MASSVQLDTVLLRGPKEKKVAKHILNLLLQHQHIDVCSALLSAVDEESIEARVFTIFLSATKSIDCILLCLRQPYSLLVRRQALKQYGKAIGDPGRWKAAWTAFGSTEGILQYLSEASVWEVKRFFRAVGNSVRRPNEVPARSLAIEELLKAMHPALYPNAPFKTSDKRPLEKFAIALVPACSSDFIRDLVEQGTKNALYNRCPKDRLYRNHGSILRKYALRVVFNEGLSPVSPDAHTHLQVFCRSEPPATSDEPRFSASMKFSEQVLETRLSNMKVRWPDRHAEASIYSRLLSRCRSRRLPKQRWHRLFDLGLRLLAAKKHLEQPFSITDDHFWHVIVENWGKWPEHWEDLFIKGLSLSLAGSVENVAEPLLKLANRSGIKKDRSWSLLRLYCLHALKNGVDVDQTQDFKFLARQRWSLQAFKKLDDGKILRLLQNLLEVNANFDFLHGASHTSVLHLQQVFEQHNFNAMLFLTQLEARSSDRAVRERARQRAMSNYKDLKGQSTRSREQKDRAQYAKAAGFVAIASGSLEMLGDHVHWLQRFIRDPLTVKTVFGGHAIAPQEASDLLSAIPDTDDPDMTLEEVSQNVAKANEILLMLHKHQQVARREPSYQLHDWQGVSSLLHSSVQTRIARAKRLQKSLDASQGDLYGAIWSQTFAMFSQTRAEYMRKVSRDIATYSRHFANPSTKLQYDMQYLMVQLPPKTLATTTRAMLEIDNKYRATKAAGQEAEDESQIIGLLTYRCLLALAKGDKPALAEDLIVRTIIDRPDASSWHRQMLSISFFKRLPAKNAERLLLGFASAIGEKLEEQSYERIGEPAGSPSIVKVTTVKYLAQLLQDANFLSPEAAIDVLLELFKVATHPDIRLATLESMLATLNTLCAAEVRDPVTNISQITNPLIHKILAALDSVIPVVGSINERRPPREQDWIDAQTDLSKLPEPNGTVTPLWQALINVAAGSTNMKSYFVNRLLLPIIELSMREHRKWLTLFLKKQNASSYLQELPATPVGVHMLKTTLLSFISLVPADMLKQMDAYARFLLDPSVSIRRLFKMFKSDPEGREKADVKHFLSVYDHESTVALRTVTMPLTTLIRYGWEPSALPADSGVTLARMQSVILSHFNLVLENYDDHFDTWDWLSKTLRHSSPLTAAQYQAWRANCRPLITNVVDLIGQKRNEEWLLDEARKPSVLPSTSQLRLWLLPYPDPSEKDELQRLRQLHDLRDGLLIWLKQQHDATGSRRGIRRTLSEAVSIKDVLSAEDMLRVSLIGTIASNVTEIESIVRVNVAQAIIEDVDTGRLKKALEKDDALLADLRAMVLNTWQKSKVEEVRETCLEWKTRNRALWNAITKIPDPKKPLKKAV